MTENVRTPPQFLEGERAILAGCLIEPAVLPKVLTALTGEDFYREAHRTIFSCYQDLHPFQEVDWVTVTGWLKEKGQLEAIGGPTYLAELIDAIPSVANIDHYITLVRKKSARRKLISQSQEAIIRCYETEDEIDQITGDLFTGCRQIDHAKTAAMPEKFSSVNRVSLSQLMTDMERKKPPGIRCGFNAIDNLTGGFRRGDLVIVAARPSMGKTALASDIALRIAETDPVVVFSFEMKKPDLWGRSISIKSGVSFMRIRLAKLFGDDLDRIVKAVGDLDDLNLFIDAVPGLTPSQARLRTEYVAQVHKFEPAVLIFDYLQIMKPDHRESTREREVASISAALKDIAMQMNCVVIALSQLNRDNTKRRFEDQRPQLQDLRESGAIENDADIVIGIWRKYVLRPEEQYKTHAEIGLMKQRNGPIGWSGDSVSWNPTTASFVDTADAREAGTFYNPPSHYEPRSEREEKGDTMATF